MTFNDMLSELLRQRKLHLNEAFGATLHGDVEIDEENGLKLVYYGHCNKVHSDVAHLYPNGWELRHAESIDEALEILGLTIHLS